MLSGAAARAKSPIVKAASAAVHSAEWVKVKATDGHTYDIHPSDLAEAQKRDPGVQLVAPN